MCFNEILNIAGPVVLRSFATDNQPYIFEAWRSVMGPASRNCVIANRYVDAEWRSNLAMVKDEALQGEIYDKLYDFVEKADGTEAKFEALVAELRLSSQSSSFAAYLERHFLRNIRLWSTHYLRRKCDLRQSIDFEISHSKIASLCELCCKYNKSVSYVTRGLIKQLLEFQSTRNRRVAEHIVEMRSAHAVSVESGTECVFPLEDGSWKVKSDKASSQFHRVVADVCDFEGCVLGCPQCEICAHKLRCECDAYADTKTCVHVHLVGSMVKTSATNVTENGANERMLAGDELLAELEDLQGTSEQRSLKVETLRILNDISRKLANINDESNLKRVHALVFDVQGNVDMVLNYGGHAKNVEFVKTSKLVKKKKVAKSCSAGKRVPAKKT